MSNFIAIDTNPWKLDDLYACVLLKAFDAPGCGVIVVTNNPDTLANATWVINSKVFNVLNAKFAEELEIDPIPVDNINTSQRLWSTYGRGYLTRKAQQLDPLCSERTRTETVDYVYTQINKFFDEHMIGRTFINSTKYMALLYYGVRDDQRKMEELFNNLVIDRLSFFNTYVNEMFRKYKEIIIVKQSANSSRNDVPLLILPRGGLPVSECFDDIKEFKCMIYPNIRGGYGVQAISDFIDDKLVNRCSCDLPAVTNTETQELIDGVRVEFVHRNKFMAVVHGELEDVKVFAKNHFK
jgi:hypothetical protein